MLTDTFQIDGYIKQPTSIVLQIPRKVQTCLGELTDIINQSTTTTVFSFRFLHTKWHLQSIVELLLRKIHL